MKKLILKTAIITFGVTLIAAISLFGIVSFCAPSAMMKLTASIGLDGISADYAYQEYTRSQNIDYLARAFELSANIKSDKLALERFEELISNDGFDEYCAEQDASAASYSPAISYRNYIIGSGACVKYRLATGIEEKQAVYTELVKMETASSFPAGNPFQALSAEAARAKDKEFCAYLLERLADGEFEENNNFNQIKSILEEVSHE